MGHNGALSDGFIVEEFLKKSWCGCARIVFSTFGNARVSQKGSEKKKKATTAILREGAGLHFFRSFARSVVEGGHIAIIKSDEGASFMAAAIHHEYAQE